MWSSWAELTPCSASCGGGTQRYFSNCEYNGTLAVLCDGEDQANKIEKNIFDKL